jgi:hypothetical protein
MNRQPVFPRVAVMVFHLLAAAVCASAQKVSPPPKPADDGPSLEVTMKFIQDKLNGLGPMNYVLLLHNDSSGENRTTQFMFEVTNVVTNPSACRISYHQKIVNPRGPFESDLEFSLKEVKDIVVMPEEQVYKEHAAASGQASWNYRTDPPVFELSIRMTDSKRTYQFRLFDEQLANRVAKAMVHAVELCGGGGEPEPF